MEMNLKGKKALVTGSTQGIGKAIALELAKEGADVFINSIEKQEIHSAVSEIKEKYPDTRPESAFGDLTDNNDIENIMDTFPKMDILVNNLGIYEMMTYGDITEATWNLYFNTNFLPADKLSRFYISKMIENDFGRIIFIGSDQAVMPTGDMPQYAVTKSMVLSLAKSLSLLTNGKDISVNTILPGTTLSDKIKSLLESSNTDADKTFKEIEREFIDENMPDAPLKKFIRPEEIGRMAAFLASPYSTAIRGSVIRMEGGVIPTII